jgi:protocatechuate 3,4-dioxygenase, alpha subunit
VTTPGQTVGPFFGFALPYDGDADLVPPTHPDAVQLTGLVLDGDGAPVPDALLEIWQPDASGNVVQAPGSLRRDGFTFTGFGRAATDNAGRYRFTTIRPGVAVPFIAMTVFARGLLDRPSTRVYLPGSPDDALPGSVACRAAPHAHRCSGRSALAVRRAPAGRGRDGVPALSGRS